MMVQSLRFLDVVALGPWLLYVARRPRLSATDRELLFLTGLGTIVINGLLWWKERQADSVPD
jgi:hypothetical protein